jgi:uncharacterized protein YggU (UPF0235/DUF167 family)
MKVKAPPEKGRANETVIALLADRLGIDPSGVSYENPGVISVVR